jgi:hypothetical protein
MASSTNIASREVNLATGPLVPSRRSQLNETISFLDHKRTCAEQNGMSVLPLKATSYASYGMSA